MFSSSDIYLLNEYFSKYSRACKEYVISELLGYKTIGFYGRTIYTCSNQPFHIQPNPTELISRFVPTLTRRNPNTVKI